MLHKRKYFSHDELSRQSHKKRLISCNECDIVFERQHRDILDTLERNNGLFYCLKCSRKLKSTGMNNPNRKFSFDRSFMSKIDTEEKAYLLGWIASDGSITKGTIAIYIHKKDLAILEIIRDIICKDIKIVPKKNTQLIGIRINSKEIVNDVCRHLKLEKPGKKSRTVQFPELENETLKSVFFRGLSAGDGSIYLKQNNLRWSIATSSTKLVQELIKLCPGLNYYKNKKTNSFNFEVYGKRAMILVRKLYESGDNKHLILERKYKKYVSILSHRKLKGLEIF